MSGQSNYLLTDPVSWSCVIGRCIVAELVLRNYEIELNPN